MTASAEPPTPAPAPAPAAPPSDALRAESQALAAVEAAAGGREGIYARLAVLADLTEKEQLLLAALVDPANDRRSLGTVCQVHGFTIGQFLALLKRGTGAKALLALHDARAGAVEEVARHLPTVAADVMLRAVSASITCPQCEGKGKIPTGKKGRPPTCKVCAGRGVVTFEAGQERQELALQLGGLLAPKPDGRAPLVSVGVSAQADARAGAAAQAGRSLDDQLGGGGMTGFVSRADQVLLAPAPAQQPQAAPQAAPRVMQLAEPQPEPELALKGAGVGAGAREDVNAREEVVVVQPAAQPQAPPQALPVIALPYAKRG